MIRILSDRGLGIFREYIDGLRNGKRSSPPVELLDQETESLSLGLGFDFPDVKSDSKYEFASSLIESIESIEAAEIDQELWPLIWSSFGLRYFDLICPRDKFGNFQPRREEHYVFKDNYKSRHRHRIYGPIVLVRHGGRALRHLMGTAPDTLGNFEEQVGSRQELAGSRVVLEVLAELYSDAKRKGAKRGFDGKKEFGGTKLASPGTLLRFVTIYRQLSRTFDLNQLTKEEFLNLLPDEFKKWWEG